MNEMTEALFKPRLGIENAEPSRVQSFHHFTHMHCKCEENRMLVEEAM